MLDAKMQKILDIGIAISGEKNRDRLLDRILTETVELTNCDAGTLYIFNGEALEFKIMITRSMGVHNGGEHGEITLPPVPLSEKNVCACGVIYGKLINIDDVYENTTYDFTGPKKYDAMTGYNTRSMMVVPMEDDKGKIIGVMQLINAQDEDGNIIPFSKEYEQILLSMGSQAAICLVNMNYSKQIEDMLDSFVKVMSAAVDERSPYNANHSRNMVKYADKFIDWLNGNEELEWKFDEQKKRIFLMSVWLHDIGKLVIPSEVMDKPDRLGAHKKDVDFRLEKIGLISEIEHLAGKLDDAAFEEKMAKLEEVKALVEKVNSSGFLPDDLMAQVEALAELRYMDKGEETPWFTDAELYNLKIRKGTLTDEERKAMQSHVVITNKLLEQVSFEGDYKQVVGWASSHHELLNGRGYPKGLSEEDIPSEVRLLTILDVYDALTAEDRPYKPPMPREKALAILDDMAKYHEVDSQVLAWFKESGAWSRNE